MHTHTLKRWVYLVAAAVGLTACSCVAVWAADGDVSMVTYFPVPYATYNNIYVTEKLDLGIKSGFTVTLQGKKQETSLLADELYLDRGTLQFQAPQLYTQTIKLGKTAESNNKASVQFTKLEIGDTLGSSTDPVGALTGKNVQTGMLYLFPALFSSPGNSSLPACIDPNGGHNVYWKKLQLGSVPTQYWYLVCGNEEQCGAKKTEHTACNSRANASWNNTNCTCNCDSGYTETDGNGVCCLASRKSNCINNNTIPTTWNGSSCTCACKEIGYQDSDNDGICTITCAQKKINCENSAYNPMMPSWSAGSCRCICPSGYQDADDNGICEAI